jgi:radical SAM superfamily enzyme YgiQ (UPF0313 family)
MHVLLIYAKAQYLSQAAEEEHRTQSRVREYSRDDLQLPLGIAYLGAILEREKIPVRLKDDSIQDDDEIREAIRWADVVGISALTPNAPRALYWAQETKSIDSAKVVVVGGPHATSIPAYFLDTEFVDFVVRWEGEESLVELVRALESGSQDFSAIGGIGFRGENGHVFTRKRPWIKDLDAIPHPARHLLPMEPYFEGLGFKSLLFWSSRGCPFMCTYCNKQMNPCNFRARSARNVVDEMELVIKDYGVEHVQFIDDYFSGDRDRIHAICREIRQRRLKIEWSCEVRMDSVLDYHLLRTMRKAGCVKCHIGIESGSQRTLDGIRKEQKVEDVIEGAKVFHQAGMFMKFFLLIGFPWETEEDIKATEAMIYKAKPHMIAISILNPMPGTKVYKDIQKAGKLVNDFNLENYHYYHCKPAFNHDHFTYDELKAHRDRITDEYLSWFYSPEQFRSRKRDKLAFYITHPGAVLERLLSGV